MPDNALRYLFIIPILLSGCDDRERQLRTWQQEQAAELQRQSQDNTAAARALVEADAAGNRIEGAAQVYKGSGSYVRSDGRFVYLAAVDDLIVVDTPDALLITSREQTRDMKPAMAQIQQSRGDLFRSHRQVHRPWGSYTVIEEGPRDKIKRIVVKPGAKSIKRHSHRTAAT